LFSADDSVAYWGDHNFNEYHHFDSIIQIRLGALRTFNSWRVTHGITGLSRLTIDDIQSSLLGHSNSVNLFEIICCTEKHKFGGKFYQGNVSHIIGAAIPSKYGYDNY
jgi:hypothetical protein